MQLNIYERKILDRKLLSIEKDLEEIIIIKDVKLRNKLLKELKEALLTSFDTQRTEAINKAIHYLVSVDAEKFTKENAKKVNAILQQALGQDLAAVLEKNVNDLSEKLFKSGISDVARSLKLKLSFDVVDSQAAKILGEHTMFWILNYYSDHLNKEMDEILKQYFIDGKLIGEVASDFATKFLDKSDRGFAYFEGLAEHTTYRVNELGKINGFEKAGIEFYEIKAIIDDRTSEVCRQMDGVIFPVSEAIKFRNTVLNLKSKEDIKKFAPWRPASEILDFKKNGFPTGMALPPYHWRCRTITIAYFGDAQELPDTTNPAQEVEITIAGIKLKIFDYENNFIQTNDIALKKTRQADVKGFYAEYVLSGKKAIFLNPLTANDPLPTFLHETGHAIDSLFFDEFKDKFLNLIKDKDKKNQIYNMILARFRRDREDLTLDNMKDLLQGLKIKYRDSTYKLSAKSIIYYLRRDEILADAYAQYRTNENFKDYAIDYYNLFSEISKALKKKYGQ